MKKLKLGMILAVCLLVGCGDQTSNQETPIEVIQTSVEASVTGETVKETTKEASQEQKGFVFEIKGLVIELNQEADGILEQLGEPITSLETPSCAYQGMDKIYSYSNIQVTTYVKEGKEYIYDIYFLDDSVATKEGLYIGASKEDMISIYGNDYIEEVGMYTYERDGIQLKILIEDDIISTIEYMAVIENK